MTVRKRAKKGIEHLNLVLRAIRKVNQLIVTEKDRNRLIKGICDNLVENRGYYNAWVALLDESGTLVATAESGLGKKFLPMVEKLKRGELTACAQGALVESVVVVTSNPSSTCTDCPLAKEYSGRGAITARLEHGGRVYGLLSASVPADFILEAEEASLFEEVVGDIAFGLRNIELEEERKQVQRAAQEAESRYRDLFNNAGNAIFIRDLKGNISEANQEASALSGYTLDELAKMNISQFLSVEGFELVMEKQQALLKGESPTERYELELIRKDGTRVVIESLIRILTKEGQTMGIQAVVWDITEQKRLRESLQFYISEITRAQEEERKRIACELHDETIQSLASLALDIDAINRAKDQLSEDTIQRLEQIRSRIDSMMEGVRRFSHELRPGVLDQMGLIPALELLTEELNKEGKVSTRIEVIGSEQCLSPVAELVLFRIAQEALRNVRKHSQATEAMVRVEFGAEKARLDVTDNGRGFELPKLPDEFAIRGKLGLIGMRERVRLLDGSFSVKSQPGKGTTVAVEVAV